MDSPIPEDDRDARILPSPIPEENKDITSGGGYQSVDMDLPNRIDKKISLNDLDKELESVPNKSEKGKEFRGGSKKERDKWYGYNDKDFQNWWHREGKKDFGGKDIDNANEAREAWETWNYLGRPNAK